MKKLLTLTLSIILLASAHTTYASAEENSNSEIEYLEDGCYLETTITDEPTLFANPGISLYATKTTTTKTKKLNYCKNGNVLWYIKVKGTFTYGNGFAKCIASEVTSKSNNSLWKLSNVRASKTGDKAIGYVTAKLYRLPNAIGLLKTVNETVTLKCSPTGNFS